VQIIEEIKDNISIILNERGTYVRLETLHTCLFTIGHLIDLHQNIAIDRERKQVFITLSGITQFDYLHN